MAHLYLHIWDIAVRREEETVPADHLDHPNNTVTFHFAPVYDKLQIDQTIDVNMRIDC